MNSGLNEYNESLYLMQSIKLNKEMIFQGHVHNGSVGLHKPCLYQW